MAEVIAKLNNLRIAPRKTRLLANMIKGKTATKARSVLAFSVKKGALSLQKLLDSAIANAKNNFHLKEDDLRILAVKVDEGRKLKRWRARARGRACRIEKKTSNITLILRSAETIQKDNFPVKQTKIKPLKSKVKTQKSKIQLKS